MGGGGRRREALVRGVTCRMGSIQGLRSGNAWNSKMGGKDGGDCRQVIFGRGWVEHGRLKHESEERQGTAKIMARERWGEGGGCDSRAHLCGPGENYRVRLDGKKEWETANQEGVKKAMKEKRQAIDVLVGDQGIPVKRNGREGGS